MNEYDFMIVQSTKVQSAKLRFRSDSGVRMGL